MSGSIEGQWKLMGSENFTEFTTVMDMPPEQEKAYSALHSTGDGGLELIISFDEGKTLTVVHKTKGENVHSTTYKIGEAADVIGIAGETRKIDTRLDGDTVVFTGESSGKEVINKLARDGDTMNMSLTCSGVTCLMTFNRVE